MGKLKHGQMSMQVMVEDCRKYGLKPGPDVVATASILLRHFKAHTQPATDIADCSTCGGKSDIKLERCPYCGDGETIVGEKLGGMPPSNGASHALPVVNGEVTPESVAIVAKANGTSKNGHAAVLNVAVPAKAPVEQELDEAIAKIHSLKGESAEAVWQLGHAIRDVYERSLWTARRSASGPEKPAYSRWEQFCTMELGIDRKTAFSLMDIAKTFTIDQIRHYGPGKLRVVVSLPEKDRTRILEQAGNKTVKEIQAEARATKKGEKQKPAKESKRVSAMVRMSDRIVVPLFRAGVRKDRHPAAKTLADKPFGVEKHGNGVESRYSIRADKETGALELVIERRREG